MAAPNSSPSSPLTVKDTLEVFNLLGAALGADTDKRKLAEKTIAQLEWCPGFCSRLLEIVSAKNAEHSVRWLASLQLKNTISWLWRPRRNTGGMSVEEKQHIRVQLLNCLAEENNQIATQIAVVFSKIARHDYPREWPSLFSDLLNGVQGGNLLLQRRIYLVLHYILKELSSKRLRADQNMFAEVTGQLMGHVWSTWCSDTHAVVAGTPDALEGRGDTQTLLLHFERWLVLLKALRRLLLFGFPSDARTAEPCAGVMQVLPPVLQALQALLPLRPQTAQTFSKTLAMLDRGLLKLVKTMGDLQATHPWAFYRSEVLAPCIHLMHSSLQRFRRGPNSPPDRFAIRCILFIHGVVTCNTYRCLEVAQLLESFWASEGRLEALVAALVRQLFPLQAAELREWKEDPGAFVSEHDAGAWQEHLRGAAETLFLALFEDNRAKLAPMILDMLRAADEACPAGAAERLLSSGQDAVAGVPTAALMKEAVYNAAGVGAFELYDYIDFPSWFCSALAPEASDTSPAAAPLRRRAILLAGCWVSKIGACRGDVYRVVEAALADQDTVIRLAAVETLRALIDDWDFQEEPFLSHVPGCLQQLASFMRGASEHETELKAFGLMSLIVERLGESLKPFLPSVLALLPEVWGHSEGNSLLRMQVMVALQSLLNVLGPESPSAYGVVLPILNSATDPANPEEANLLEDGLALWLVALRNAASPHPGLLGIFPNLHAVMARSTEHIQSACSIMVSAILLGGASFLQQHGAPLLAIITDALGAVNERGMLLLLPVVETIIVGFPQEAPLSLERPLAKLLSLLLGGGESTAVAAAACGLYARLLLNRPDEWLGYFHRYASQVPLPPDAPEAPSPGERLMLAFLDRWLAQLDTIAQPSARKLSGLALCHLFRVGSGGIVDRLETIIAAVTGLFHESEAGPDDGGRAVYGFDYSASTGLRVQADEPQAVLDSEDAEGETVRKRRLLESDPVNHQKISKVLRGSLELCTKVHGTRFETALQAADPVLTNQLRAVLQAP